MSLNVIIVAVLVLIVLVVLILIFTGKTKMFSKVTSSCEAKGGQCEVSCADGYVEHFGTDCAARHTAGEGVRGPKCCENFK